MAGREARGRGTVVEGRDGAGPLTVSLTIDAAPEQAWRTLVRDRGTWWPELRFAATVGAPLALDRVSGGRPAPVAGVVTEVDPPRVLSFRWSEPGATGELAVTVWLEPGAWGTDVSVVEDGFAGLRPADGPDPGAGLPAVTRRAHVQGWTHRLRRWREATEAAADGW